MLVLLLANVGYFAWARGTLAPFGLAPTTQSEPQRLAQQIRPDAVRILTPAEVRQLDGTSAPPAAAPAKSPSYTPPNSSIDSTPIAVSAESTDTQCLQAGAYTDEQSTIVSKRLKDALPPGSWSMEKTLEPARWIVYMGRYADAESLEKKKTELRQRHVAFQLLENPRLEPGLSLGSYSSQAEAEVALERTAELGVKTARVMQGRPELAGHNVKLAAVDRTLLQKLGSMKSELMGKPLQPCR